MTSPYSLGIRTILLTDMDVLLAPPPNVKPGVSDGPGCRAAYLCDLRIAQVEPIKDLDSPFKAGFRLCRDAEIGKHKTERVVIVVLLLHRRVLRVRRATPRLFTVEIEPGVVSQMSAIPAFPYPSRLSTRSCPARC